MERTSEPSPRLKARVAGAFYLGTFVTGALGLFAGSSLIVRGDAVATAANVLAHESLLELSAAANLLATACYIVVTALFYDLFKLVNRRLSLLAAFFSLVGCAIGAVSFVFQLAPLVVLGGKPYLGVFKMEELQALALVFINVYAQAYNISLVFFGFYCLLIGYLIFESTFLPRILGVLMGFAGLGWLTFLSPSLAKSLYPYVLAPGIIGEGALTLWLLAMGVNAQRWKEHASAAAASS
jgi:hypothetical protein